MADPTTFVPVALWGQEKLMPKLARYLLGFIYFINGLNWVWKVLPYPSMGDPRMSQTPAFVQALLDTGFMFAVVRAIEFVGGVALLANLWTPLTLVALFPITVIIWLVDVFILGANLRAEVMGWAVLLLNCFLLLTYVDVYRPMLARESNHQKGESAPQVVALTLGGIGNLVGLVAVGWLCVMIVSRLLPGR